MDMKIVSWNCNRSFRTKYQRLLELNADIYIIQECEPLSKIRGPLLDIIKNGFWIPGRHTNGVLVFGKSDVHLELLSWESYGIRGFLPVLVNHQFPLVGIWTQGRGYIEEFYVWYCIHRNKITDDFVFFGDFNSNQQFDEKHDYRSHSAVVDMLSQDGLVSAYHSVRHEIQGCESIPTWYMYRRNEKTFHIDHCFLRSDRIVSYTILDTSWLDLSDHVPIVLDLLD